MFIVQCVMKNNIVVTGKIQTGVFTVLPMIPEY